MKAYELHSMIIDNDFDGEEYVTADFTHEDQIYSITFKKADLEIINIWVFQGDGTSLPASLPDYIIESIREDVQKKI